MAPSASDVEKPVLCKSLCDREKRKFDIDGSVRVRTDEVKTVRTLDVNANLTIEGRAQGNNADPAAAVWQLKRIVTFGSTTIEEPAGTGEDCGKYKFVFNDWESAFPPLPVINEFSALLDGVNDIIDVADDPSISFERTDPFSYSIWAKRTGPAAIDVLGTKIGPVFNGYTMGS